MTEYPILVERFEDSQSLTVACEKCGASALTDPDERGWNFEGFFECPKNCGGMTTWKYEEADHKCGGCGKLGFFADALGNCCSRPCQLQAEYARELEARKGAAA